ncbi:MAG: rhodanese-like domain-containing protein [Flavobacteriaceae bacterium]|nr:rhodanese-like domain-containing protein [Flavobacteriaceae bacterium]
MKKLSIVLFVIIGFSLLNCKQTSAQQSTLLEPKEMKEFLASNDVLLIDVRTPQEFKSGHIENAVNVDFKSSDFSEAVQKLDTTKTLVIYCRSGRRSGMGTTEFIKAGFDEVLDLKGGVLNWQKQGLELVK